MPEYLCVEEVSLLRWNEHGVYRNEATSRTDSTPFRYLVAIGEGFGEVSVPGFRDWKRYVDGAAGSEYVSYSRANSRISVLWQQEMQSALEV